MCFFRGRVIKDKCFFKKIGIDKLFGYLSNVFNLKKQQELVTY